MAEEHNLIIDHLQSLRSHMGEVKGSLRGIKEEMISLPQHMGGLKR
jgi:hypothetical protein